MAERPAAAEVAAAFEAHFTPLYRFALSRLPGAEEEAADAVQEAFLALAASPRAFRGDSSLSTWLHAVVRNRTADRWRRAARRERMERRTALAAETPDGPEDGLFREADRVAVRDALAAVPAEGRYALIMKYVDGMPQKEMARILGKNEKAVESVLFRARAAFRSAYREVLR